MIADEGIPLNSMTSGNFVVDTHFDVFGRDLDAFVNCFRRNDAINRIRGV